jgi:hypothetical protein
MAKKAYQNNPKVLGLDVSTKTIGWALFDMRTQELLELTHISPRPKVKTENKIEELLSKAEVFKTKLDEYKNLGITKDAFPQLLQNNDKGKMVLFGGLPKDIDKKEIIWDLVAKREPQITWQYTRNNTLKKENFDQTDAYCAVLGHMKSEKIW